MDNKNGEKFVKALEKIKSTICFERISDLKDKCKTIFVTTLGWGKNTLSRFKNVKWHKLPINIWNMRKKIKIKKSAIYRGSAKMLKKLSDSWKTLLTVIPLFLFFYYVIGSLIVENIDVKTQYKIEKDDNVPFFKTADSMAFLIKREVDDKMWTPNLPLMFPAYILDNMPNFQIGIITAVKDMAGTLRYFKHNTDAQNKDIKNAYKFLNYAPNVWIMSRKGKFNLAPSSNSQYRKAANELRKFVRDGIYKPNSEDLALVMKKLSTQLQKLTVDSENYQQENSNSWLNEKNDDIFYNHKGYAFAMWQMSRVLCRDYKEIILENNLYEDWVRLSKSLQKAAEFSPLIIRNGKIDSAFTPNHLIMQNYYLLRAISAALKITGSLSERFNAD